VPLDSLRKFQRREGVHDVAPLGRDSGRRPSQSESDDHSAAPDVESTALVETNGAAHRCLRICGDKCIWRKGYDRGVWPIVHCPGS
jgi:hypothetical protein